VDLAVKGDRAKASILLILSTVNIDHDLIIFHLIERNMSNESGYDLSALSSEMPVNRRG
jgi:hypothetical protein